MRHSLSACRLTWFCSDVLDSPALQDSLNPIDRALLMGIGLIRGQGMLDARV